jgi:hypothetical protein
LSSPDAPDTPDQGRLADPGSLRRIEAVAAGWGVVAAFGWWLASSRADWTGAAVLTGAAAASIVGFRALQRIVSALGPTEDQTENQPAGRPDATHDAEPAGSHDRRSGLGAPGIGFLVRLGLLGAAIAAGAFLLEPEHFPAVVLGFSTLPAALVIEGLWQVVRAFRERGRGRDRHDGS